MRDSLLLFVIVCGNCGYFLLLFVFLICSVVVS